MRSRAVGLRPGGARKACLVLALGLLGAVLAACERPARAQGEDPRGINWGHTWFPPFYCEQDGETFGVAHDVEDMLRRGMPDMRHTVAVMNTRRLLKMMEWGEQVCTTLLIRTEQREEYLAFSLPVFTSPPPAAIVRAEDRARFGPGPVSLREVLARGDVRVAVVGSRSYGGGIDAVLADMADTPGLAETLSEEMSGQSVRMLLSGRFDLTIAYPVEALYAARVQEREGDIAVIPLAENRDYNVGHAACPDTPWGRGVVAHINAVLRENVGTDAYFERMSSYVPDGVSDEYRRRFEELVVRPARDGAVE